jgi:hypothetical protein
MDEYMEDIQRETKDGCPPLTQQQLSYLRTGVTPGTYSRSAIENNIEDKIDAIPNRLAAFVEDLQILQDSEAFDDYDWSDLWTSLSDPESKNAVYSDLFEKTDLYEEFNGEHIEDIEPPEWIDKEPVGDTNVGKQPYQIGLQLGHLAHLLIRFADQSADKRQKSRQAALTGIALGIRGYGLTSVGSQFSDEIDDEIIHFGDWGGNKQLDFAHIDKTFRSARDFEEDIETLLLDFPPFPRILKGVIAEAGLEPVSPVVNAVFNESRNVTSAENKKERFETAIDSIKKDCEVNRIEDMCNYLRKDIRHLLEESSSSIGPEVTETEVLRAAYLSSESNTNDIYSIVRNERDGNEEKLKTDNPINSVLVRLKGKASTPTYWDDNPIISQDNTPNPYGSLIAQIIFEDNRVRPVDRYLPTTNDANITAPSPTDIRKACYAFALDGPSIESINGSWATLFNDAYRERINKDG